MLALFSVADISSGVTPAALACSMASSINSPAPSPTPPKAVLRRSCPVYEAASSAVIGVACSPSPPRPKIFDKAAEKSNPAGLIDNKPPRPPDKRPPPVAAAVPASAAFCKETRPAAFTAPPRDAVPSNTFSA